MQASHSSSEPKWSASPWAPLVLGATLMATIADLAKSAGSWDTAHVFGAVLAATGGVMAIFVLQSMRIARAERLPGGGLRPGAATDGVH